MPVPKRKRSRVRRDKRFANKGIKVKTVVGCKTCNSPLSPHAICTQCGHYKGVKILRTKVDRSETRAVLKQMKTSKRVQTTPDAATEAS
ncbi:50S ribosomal protein L32 [bacterium]|nr:MAG: 50S ribosomal protein L32 [bacterium]QQR61543.1 MAG: 50S ribosomal protein L32 [bacterium]QQR62927.1 MAG: 50S ribosomal protein L32 [bacterium]